MKLSNKGRYGVQALFDLAYHNDGKAAQIKDISVRQDIPARFLEQVFQDLRRAGIVTSKRGPRGGYQLASAAAEVRLGDIIRAIEGPLSLCPAEGPGRDSGLPTTGQTVTHDVFGALAERLEGCFDAVSLADLCDRADALGLRRSPRSGYVYAI